jgi:hypothetical protein
MIRLLTVYMGKACPGVYIFCWTDLSHHPRIILDLICLTQTHSAIIILHMSSCWHPEVCFALFKEACLVTKKFV